MDARRAETHEVGAPRRPASSVVAARSAPEALPILAVAALGGDDGASAGAVSLEPMEFRFRTGAAR